MGTDILKIIVLYICYISKTIWTFKNFKLESANKLIYD